MDYSKLKITVLEKIDDIHSLIQCKDFKFKVRDEKIDAWVIDEVIYKSGYLKFLELKKEDVVIDIGGNIGSFSVIAAGLCKKIYTFEPDIDNYNLILENLALNNIKNVEVFNKAITTYGQDLRFYINDGVCADCHSTEFVRGRRCVLVESVALKEILKKYKPNKLKVDCEGEELNFMRKIDLSCVERFIAEIHFKLSWRDKHLRYHDMMKNVNKHFSNVNKIKVNNDWSRILKAIR